MQKRVKLVSVLAALIVVAVAAMASISAAKSGAGKNKFTVVEHATTDTIVGGGTGSTTGEILTFHNELFDDGNTTVVGTDQGQCIRIDPAAGTWECAWTNFLEGGQITVEGPFFDTSDSTLAVTGGTGAYKNARGSMKLVAQAGGTEFRFEFRLTG